MKNDDKKPALDVEFACSLGSSKYDEIMKHYRGL